MRYIVWGLIVLLLVAHQDFWFWDDPTLVFGFMPITLLYHAGISLVAGITWFLATQFCWPDVLEDDSPGPEQGGHES
jgi:hypothetical protein